MQRLVTLGIACGLAACGHTLGGGSAAAVTKSVVFSLHDIGCQSCGAASVHALQQHDGVEAVSFERDAVEVTVRYDPSATDPKILLKVVQGLGYEVEIGAGKGRYLPEVEFPSELDVIWISRDGSAVTLEDHLQADKVTVFDFYAPWCGPCREVDSDMMSVLRESSDVALRKLNVVNWESGVARQYLSDVASLPYVIVYSKSGKRVEAISGLHLDRLHRAIERARGL